METHKETSLLIERLKTYEIDNLKEAAEQFPASFRSIMRDLETKRYWMDCTFDTVISMCDIFTLDGEKIGLNEFHIFFKK